ncbi:hypothetical protein K491DRAFT_760352 [Lophiostoma macrostomum CBS 122681]|uniref:Tctex-1 n=1 Tax=Lophiostoma macrostomum CBS 122681 TaxID=1314788 RepID=A0A6A6SY69_9PLEO|nr:hypothetical protein K491DRAFT_760352 [Lophiostoma macrostomum CBS 122681]
MAAPLETSELQKIATQACENAVGTSDIYDHSSVADWNTNIINSILSSLTAPYSDENTSPYKFIVNSTVIQHIGSPSEASTAGRRGMHSAVGAYWNGDKDGTWSFKWEGAEAKGMDIVLSITWIGV